MHNGLVVVSFQLVDCPAGAGGLAVVPGSHKGNVRMPSNMRDPGSPTPMSAQIVKQTECSAGDVPTPVNMYLLSALPISRARARFLSLSLARSLALCVCVPGVCVCVRVCLAFSLCVYVLHTCCPEQVVIFTEARESSLPAGHPLTQYTSSKQCNFDSIYISLRIENAL